MAIKIVTDSTCDLPADIVAQYGITVVPLYINMGGQSYRDGVDLSREAFYTQLPDFDPPPTTASPGPQMFLEAYENLARDGASAIISIHIARSLSAVVDVAHLAARDASIPVTVLDSGSLSLGIGFMVQTAAMMAAQGHSVETIVAALKAQGKRTHVFAVLETLEFLKRGGRMHPVIATLGSWLQIKPLLKMNDGVPTAEKVRTTDAALTRLVALLKAQLPLEKVALVHTHAPEKVRELRERAKHLLPQGDILAVDITPVFGVHLGPGAAGFACISANAGKE